MVKGFVEVLRDTQGSKGTGVWTLPLSFKLEGPADYCIATFALSLYNAHASDATTDSGPLCALNYIEPSVGGQKRGTIYGINESDYATGHGMLGGLSRLIFREDITQSGDGSTAAAGTEVRTFSIKIPVGGGKMEYPADCVLNTVWNAAANWTASGTPSVSAVLTKVIAHYVDAAPEVRFRNLTWDAITGASYSTKTIEDAPGMFVVGVVATLMQSSAYEGGTTAVANPNLYLEELTLEDSGGRTYARMDDITQANYNQGAAGLVIQYASTKTYIDSNEGVFGMPVEGVEAKGLKIGVRTGSSASSATIQVLVILSSASGGVFAVPSQTPASSSLTGSQGMVQKR